MVDAETPDVVIGAGVRKALLNPRLHDVVAPKTLSHFRHEDFGAVGGVSRVGAAPSGSSRDHDRLFSV